MEVLGLDTDSKGMHWVSTVPINDYEDFDTPTFAGSYISNHLVESRRVSIYFYAKKLFANTPDDLHIYCEEPLSLQNGKTSRLLALAAGVIWAAYVDTGGIFWHWVDVAHWKKVVIGNGHANKLMIRAHAQSDPVWQALADRSPYETFPSLTYHDMFEKNKNLYDAFCLREYGRANLH